MIRPQIDPLSSEVESLLAREREIVSIDEDVRARILERARSTVRTSANGAAARPVASAMSISTWLFRPRMVAAGALGLLLFALAAAALYRERSAQPAPRSSSISIREPSTNAVESSPSAAAKAGLAEENAGGVANGASNELAPSPLDRDNPVKSRDLSRPIATRPHVHDDPAIVELRLLQRAREAAARRDFPAVLAAVGEHERRFPSGELVEEREALRVKALAGLGQRDEAARAASAFRERFPKSVLLPPLEEAAGPTP